MDSMGSIEKYNDTNSEDIEDTNTKSVIAQNLQLLQSKKCSTFEIRKALKALESLTEGCQEERLDIVNILLQSIERHPGEVTIELLTLSNLFNLREHVITHKDILSKIIDRTLSAMEMFSDDRSLCRKSFEIIRHFWPHCHSNNDNCLKFIKLILTKGLTHDPLRGLKVIENPLMQYLPNDEFKKMSTDHYWEREIFKIFKNCLKTKTADDVKLLLVALQILCQLSQFESVWFFLLKDSQNMDIIVNLLTTFQEEDVVLQKLVYICSYAVRVKGIAYYLKSEPVVKLLKTTTRRPDFNISYYSTSVLAYMILYEKNSWHLRKPLTLDNLNFCVKLAVSNWDEANEILTSYELLQPLIEMMKTSAFDGLQLFASWTLWRLVCSSEKKYLELIDKEENVLSYLLQYVKSSTVDAEITCVKQVIKMFFKYSNIPDYLMSIYCILTILACSLDEDEVIKFLKMLNKFLESDDKKAIDSTAKVLFKTAVNYEESIAVQNSVISCFLTFTKSLDPVKKKEILARIVRYAFKCTRIFLNEKTFPTASTELLKMSMKRLLGTEDFLSTMNFSAFDKKVVTLDWECDIGYVISHLLLLTLAFNDNIAVIANFLESIEILTLTMSLEEMQSLVEREDFRFQLHALLKHVTDKPFDCTLVTRLLKILNRLNYLSDMKKFLRERVTIDFLKFLVVYKENGPIVIATTKILINCGSTYSLSDHLLLVLYDDHLPPDSRHSVFMLLLFWPKVENAKRSELLVSLLSKWKMKNESYQLCFPVSFLCNSLLNEESAPYYKLFARWVLDKLAFQDPVHLREHLEDLGDIEELKIIAHSQNSESRHSQQVLSCLNRTNYTAKKYTFDQLRNILRNDLTDPEDFQKCLHFLRIHDEKHLIHLEDVAVVIQKINSYHEFIIFYYNRFFQGILREAVAFFHCFLLTNNGKNETITIFKSVFAISKARDVTKRKENKTVMLYIILCFQQINLQYLDCSDAFNILKYLYETVDDIEFDFKKELRLRSLIDNLKTKLLDDLTKKNTFGRVDMCVLQRNINVEELICCHLKCLHIFYVLGVNLNNCSFSNKLHFDYYESIIDKGCQLNETKEELVIVLCWSLLGKMSDFTEFYGFRKKVFNFSREMLQDGNSASQFSAVCLTIEISKSCGKIINEKLSKILIDVLNNLDITGEIIIMLRGLNICKNLHSSLEKETTIDKSVVVEYFKSLIK